MGCAAWECDPVFAELQMPAETSTLKKADREVNPTLVHVIPAGD